MKGYSLSHLADHLLSRELSTLVAQDWAATARLLACLAEFDDRKLYLPAGHPSMFAYCVRELHMSEDMAFKRIRAARAARAFPAIFPALAEGRLHLSSVILLAPYLSPGTAESLLVAATHKSKAEIELLLAERFPRPDVPTLVRALHASGATALAGPTVSALAVPAVPALAGPRVPALAGPAVRALAGPVVPMLAGSAEPGLEAPEMRGVPEPPVHEVPPSPACAPESMQPRTLELRIGQGVGDTAQAACEIFHEVAPGPVVPSSEPKSMESMGPLQGDATSRARVAPLSPGRYAIQVTVDQETYEQLRYAQALLGHAVPSGDVAQVLKRALNVLVEQLEKRKLAKASRARPRRSAANGRYIPAEVRRAVWQRDGGQCTFVSDKGHRCDARTRLEIDHIHPVARGGLTTLANTRLRCRAHNQFAAECAYGAGFMREKRDTAKRRAAGEHSRATSPAPARVPPSPAPGDAPADATDLDVIPWLRQLGYGAEQARRGASLVAHIPDASLEERVKLALRGLMPASVRRIAPMPTGAS